MHNQKRKLDCATNFEKLRVNEFELLINKNIDYEDCENEKFENTLPSMEGNQCYIAASQNKKNNKWKI